MNTSGNLAGFIAPTVVAYILRSSNDDWALTFFVSAAIYFAWILCWMFIDPIPPLDDEAAAAL